MILREATPVLRRNPALADPFVAKDDEKLLRSEVVKLLVDLLQHGAALDKRPVGSQRCQFLAKQAARHSRIGKCP